MKYLLTIIFFCLNLSFPVFAESLTASTTLEAAINNHAAKVQVSGTGVVKKILRDDTYGDRHQKFIVLAPNGSNILIVYNIDIAERIDNLKRGDSVEFTGEYIWNDKGGLVHWTHHDPRGRHANGWIKHKGKIYQ